MAARQITVSSDGGATNTPVSYADDTKIVPTAHGPMAVSAFEVGHSVCVRVGCPYVEIVSIP